MSAMVSKITIGYSKRLFRHRSKKTTSLRVTGHYEGNSSVTDEFPAQRASNAEKVTICLRHNGNFTSHMSRLTQSRRESNMSQFEMSSITSLDIGINRMIKTAIPNPDK